MYNAPDVSQTPPTVQVAITIMCKGPLEEKYRCEYHTIPYHTIPHHTIPYHTIPYPPTRYGPLAPRLAALWSDPAVQRCWDRRVDFYRHDLPDVSAVP